MNARSVSYVHQVRHHFEESRSHVGTSSTEKYLDSFRTLLDYLCNFHIRSNCQTVG